LQNFWRSQKANSSLPAQTFAKEERADERRFFFTAKKKDVLLLLETWQETVQKQVQPLQ
jgi:hypothetical protein